MSCYLCHVGDPHEHHQTASEVYGTADALRLDDANHAAGIRACDYCDGQGVTLPRPDEDVVPCTTCHGLGIQR